MGNLKKKVLFIFRKAPYASSLTKETIDLLLVCGTFEQSVSVLWIEDGVFTLKKEQQDQQMKNVSKTFAALPLYDITNCLIHDQALAQRGMTLTDCILPAELISSIQIPELIKIQDFIFTD